MPASSSRNKAPRQQKLKVFRTTIGFHDAYVAAPSQQAALQAWGSHSNLFAQGAAEQVTEPQLTAAPLKQPGEVVKVLRGTEEEQLKALGPARSLSRASGKGGQRTSPRRPRPSRAKLERAEQALNRAEAELQAELAQLQKEEEALARRRRALQQSGQVKLDRLQAALERARDTYGDAINAWSQD